MCKENKIQIITFFNNFFSSVSVSAVHSDENTRMRCSTVERASNSDTEEKKSLNKVVFVYIAHKVFS